MDNTGITPVMPMGDMGGSSFMWVFGLIVLLALFNGSGFSGGNGNSNAIQNDINRGFDSQNLQAQTRDILGAVTGGTSQTIAASTANATNAINAIKDGNASLIREFGNVENALTALGGAQQQCCCNILRSIDEVNYNAALNTASINATTTAQTQKILDLLTTNRMADMQNQINALQLNAAVAGVVRYPMTYVYSAGTNPFCPGTTTSTGTGA